MKRWRSIGPPIFVLIGLSLAVIYTWTRFLQADRDAAHARVTLVAEQAALRLEDCIRARFLVLEVVRDEIASGVTPDRVSFTERTKHLQRQFDGFQAINWIDDQGVIRWASPEAPNRAALGRNVHDHPVAGPVLRAVQASRSPAITPPLELFQGGLGFTSYWPIRNPDGSSGGFVNGVFRTEALVRTALGSTLDRFDVWIEDDGATVYGIAESIRDRGDARPTGIARLDLEHRFWNLCVVPRSETWGTLSYGRHLPFLVGGIGVALVLAIALATVLERSEERGRQLEERRALQSRLDEAQKMEAIGRLAGGVAHDFNNLITAIMGGTDLVLASATISPRDRRLLEQIISTCERAADLTEQLLTFSSRKLVEHPEVDVGAELQSMRPLLDRLARDDISIQFESTPIPGVARLNPGQLGQIVLNLFLNAMDAMPDGGPVQISARPSASGPRGEPGNWALVTVRDRGTGISDDVRERIFEPFFTTKGKGKGTGLGLSMVYGLVTKAGGELRVNTKPGFGSTFEAWLPTETASAEPEPAPPAPPPDRQPLTGRVLLVEDQAAVRAVAADILRGAGLEVVEADDGEDALTRVDAGERFDWLVTDAVMPRMGGMDLLRRLRERDLDFGAILCSGYAAEVENDDLEEVEAIFLPKPYAAASLLDALARCRRADST